MDPPSVRRKFRDQIHGIDCQFCRLEKEVHRSKYATTLTILITVFALAGHASAEIVLNSGLDYKADTVYEDDKDLLDIYMPVDAKNVPVVVYFHGGALSMGSKAGGKAVAERIVSSGIGVVSANYRLSPRFMHPAHIDDAASATAWVFENIERFGGDPKKIFVAGHSAGGYLAALLALDASHLSAHSLGSESLRGAIPISPFLYVEETAPERPKTVWGENPNVWLSASITPHIHAGQRPMLLIYADGDADWRRKQNDRFAAAMNAAGNDDVRLVEVSNRDHMSLISEIAANDDRIVDLIVKFIQEH